MNPILYTRLYEVDYADGTIKVITTNVIVENVLAHVDEEGHRQLMLDKIIDHRTNGNEIKKENGIFTMSTGLKRKNMTTRGWELCVNWKDG